MLYYLKAVQNLDGGKAPINIGKQPQVFSKGVSELKRHLAAMHSSISGVLMVWNREVTAAAGDLGTPPLIPGISIKGNEPSIDSLD